MFPSATLAGSPAIQLALALLFLGSLLATAVSGLLFVRYLRDLEAVLAGELLYVTLENELRVYVLAGGDLVSSLEHDAIAGLNPPQVLEDLVVLKGHRGLYRIVSV